MFSREVIEKLSMDAAVKAASERQEPYVPFEASEVDKYPPFPFPFLGDYEPPGWEQTDERWFVDMSGFGRDYEPALSVDRFREQLRVYIQEHPGYGFALVEVGQFQGYVASFREVN